MLVSVSLVCFSFSVCKLSLCNLVSCLTPPLPGRKYEKSKAMLQEYRRSADRYEAACRESQERAVRERQRYDMLQQHAEEARAR